MEYCALGHEGHSKKYRGLSGMDALPWSAQPPKLNLIVALCGSVEVGLGQIWGRMSEPVEAVKIEDCMEY